MFVYKIKIETKTFKHSNRDPKLHKIKQFEFSPSHKSNPRYSEIWSDKDFP